MNITYDYYRIFYYVAKYQSFTLAANALYSSQPNITRSIKRLEFDLGCTLFIRSNKGVELTPEEYAIGIRLEDTVLLEKINAAIDEMAADGTLKALAEKYDLADVYAFEG